LIAFVSFVFRFADKIIVLELARATGTEYTVAVIAKSDAIQFLDGRFAATGAGVLFWLCGVHVGR